MKKTAALILAAGKGTRMRSSLPKPLVPFMGKPIVSHLIDTFHSAGIQDIFLVVGHGAEEIKNTIGNQVEYIYQNVQKGTAHAVMHAQEKLLYHYDHVFVFVGDSPLISPETVRDLWEYHTTEDAECTFLSADFPVKLPYARVMRERNDMLLSCVEEKDCTEKELLITELLSSHFIFQTDALFHYLEEIKPDKENGEYYLTDLINIFIKTGLSVKPLKIDDYKELVGLNTPEDVQWAEQFISSPHS